MPKNILFRMGLWVPRVAKGAPVLRSLQERQALELEAIQAYWDELALLRENAKRIAAPWTLRDRFKLVFSQNYRDAIEEVAALKDRVFMRLAADLAQDVVLMAQTGAVTEKRDLKPVIMLLKAFADDQDADQWQKYAGMETEEVVRHKLALDRGTSLFSTLEGQMRSVNQTRRWQIRHRHIEEFREILRPIPPIQPVTETQMVERRLAFASAFWAEANRVLTQAIRLPPQNAEQIARYRGKPEHRPKPVPYPRVVHDELEHRYRLLATHLCDELLRLADDPATGAAEVELCVRTLKLAHRREHRVAFLRAATLNGFLEDREQEIRRLGAQIADQVVNGAPLSAYRLKRTVLRLAGRQTPTPERPASAREVFDHTIAGGAYAGRATQEIIPVATPRRSIIPIFHRMGIVVPSGYRMDAEALARAAAETRENETDVPVLQELGILRYAPGELSDADATAARRALHRLGAALPESAKPAAEAFDLELRTMIACSLDGMEVPITREEIEREAAQQRAREIARAFERQQELPPHEQDTLMAQAREAVVKRARELAAARKERHLRAVLDALQIDRNQAFALLSSGAERESVTASSAPVFVVREIITHLAAQQNAEWWTARERADATTLIREAADALDLWSRRDLHTLPLGCAQLAAEGISMAAGARHPHPPTVAHPPMTGRDLDQITAYLEASQNEADTLSETTAILAALERAEKKADSGIPKMGLFDLEPELSTDPELPSPTQVPVWNPRDFVAETADENTPLSDAGRSLSLPRTPTAEPRTPTHAGTAARLGARQR